MCNEDKSPWSAIIVQKIGTKQAKFVMILTFNRKNTRTKMCFAVITNV